MLGGFSLVSGLGITLGSSVGPDGVGHLISGVEVAMDLDGLSIVAVDNVISFLLLLLPVVLLGPVLLEDVVMGVLGLSLGYLLASTGGGDLAEALVVTSELRAVDWFKRIASSWLEGCLISELDGLDAH